MEWLALVILLGLLGPLLALPKRFGIPVALGEILIGAVVGKSGFDLLPHEQPVLQVFSSIGFALVMMLVASHIDLRAVFNSKVVVPALGNIAGSAIVALGLAVFVAGQTGLRQPALLAVLFVSSSAAVILPAVSSTKPLKQYAVFVAQVAFADLIAIVALPIVASGTDGLKTALGAIALAILALVAYLLLRKADSSGLWNRMRAVSRERRFGLELRISLLLLLAAATLAQQLAVSIMLAGVAVGLAIGVNGFPKRLSKQLFAVSEGLFAPVFFVLLGAGIDFRAVFGNVELLTFALCLAVAAIVAHLFPTLLGLPARYALISSAQLGVPAAAVQLGQSAGFLTPGQGAAIMLAAMLTLAVTTFSVAGLKRRIA